MNEFPLNGPGSQPGEMDGSELDILQLPSGMDTYIPPPLPEPEEVHGLDAALALLHQLGEQLSADAADAPQPAIVLNDLDPRNRALVDQVLGEGEVSIVIEGAEHTRIQESVLAGVWRIQQSDNDGLLLDDRIEVGPIPQRVVQHAFAEAKEKVELVSPLPPGVLNAPPLFSEINEKCRTWKPGKESHVINLTLLPQTEEDLGFLQQQLGAGKVSILSRGYGNCRISSSGTRNVWWVQYFNSQDNNILNSLEITDVPNVACAAPEDIADSAIRLDEILEIYR
jgi:hydrogenase-1 operon protein HyaF